MNKFTTTFAVAYLLALSGIAQAQQPVSETAAKAVLHVPQAFELTQDTFINLTLENTDPDRVSAIVSHNIYDNFENIVIPEGSRLFGKKINQVNNSHDIIWVEIQLSSTGQTYTFEPPLHATTPLGSTGLVDFKRAASAGTILARDIIIPH